MQQSRKERNLAAKKQKCPYEWDMAGISVISCNQAKTFFQWSFPFFSSWIQRNLEPKQQKRSFQWDIARISMISCKQAKIFIQCKKAKNSVIQQQNGENVVFSEIKLKSVN